MANWEYFADDTLKRVFYTDVAGNPLSTPEVNFTYDPQRPRLATMTDTTGTTQYGYHPINAADGLLGDGLLATVDGPLAEDTFTYGYDVLGRVVSRSLGGAGTTNVVAYGFNDPLGRLKTVTDPLGEFTRSYEGVTGRVANVQRLGGMRTVFSWEPGADRRLTGIRYEDAAANVLAQVGYGYQFSDMTNDPTAQIRQWTQWHRGLGGMAATQAKKWDFRYDDVDQLIEGVKAPVAGGAVESSLGYGYDPAGNRNQVLENGVAQEFTVNGKNELTGTAATQSAPVRFAGTVSAASTVTLAGQPATMSANGLAWEKTLALSTGAQSLELLATEATPPPGKPAETTRRHVNLTLTAAPAASFAYDENGSLLSAIRPPLSALTLEWDAANRLSAIVKDGQRTEFTYDGQSRWTRIVEKNGPLASAPVLTERRIVWEGYAIAQLRDYDASDTLTGVRHLFAEGEVRTATLPAPLSSGTSLLHLRDHLGSVREVVNTTDLAVRARYDYASYGQRTKLAGDLDCDFGFTGHYEHASGITLAPFRGYHSTLGRWLSRDPIEEAGGINLYGYVRNNPINSVDPFGLDQIEITYKGVTYRAYRYSGDMSSLKDQTFGEGNLRGECAAGVQALTGAPNTSNWRANTPTLSELLANNVKIPSGTAFASMGGPGGRYGGGAGNSRSFDHTVMFDSGGWKISNPGFLGRLFGQKSTASIQATYGNQFIRSYNPDGSKTPEPYFFRTDGPLRLRGGSNDAPYRLVSDSIRR